MERTRFAQTIDIANDVDQVFLRYTPTYRVGFTNDIVGTGFDWVVDNVFVPEVVSVEQRKCFALPFSFLCDKAIVHRYFSPLDNM